MADAAISALFDKAQVRTFRKTMNCADCGTECEKRGGKQKYCDLCREKHKRRGIGSLVGCLGCGVEIVLDNGNRKYCGPCFAVSFKASQKRARTKNVEARRAKSRAWYKKNKDKLREAERTKRAKEGEAVRAKEREYYAATRERKRELARAAAQRRKKERAEYARRPEVKAKAAEGKARDRKSDPGKRVHWNMSRAVRLGIKNKGGRKWQDVVGYTHEELMAHLESQFEPGMTWDNYGKYGWHIDHKRPRAAFNFTSSEDTEFGECWSLKNLRPLWAHDNLTKSDKLEGAPLGLARFIHKAPPQEVTAL